MEPDINCLALSQTQGYFAVGTTIGFEIIENNSTTSIRKLKNRVVLNESVIMIEMMYKSNFLALVFDKDPTKVIIWDDFEEKTRTEVSFHSEVLKILLSKELLVVALEEKVFVFDFNNLKCIDQIETIENPNGIVALSQGEKPVNTVVICPHEFEGMLKVHTYVKEKSVENIFRTHETEIGSLSINLEGTLLASASIKGTIIRIHDVETGDQLQELRRGTGKAFINQILFHPTINLLAC